LRRGTPQQKCWFSRAPSTKIQIHCGEKNFENLNTKAAFKNKITTFNTGRKNKMKQKQ